MTNLVRDTSEESLSRDAFLAAVKFDDKGLVPAVAQDAGSGAVLMVAWMNRDALSRTLASGDVTYWSRSRGALWRKGETSGHAQRLVEAWIDCDGDTVLLKVDQTGPACHTGAPTCFFRRATP
jgi:phosphoribosyl-AMP cyclohydrolase